MADLPGLHDRIKASVERWNDAHGIKRDSYALFCKKADLPVSTMQGYMPGAVDRSEPRLENLITIARTAGVTLDYLIFGGELTTTTVLPPSAREAVKAAIQALRRAAAKEELPRHLFGRYRDLVGFIEIQMHRLVFDAERFLGELQARAKANHFDADEFRRKWLSGEEDDSE